MKMMMLIFSLSMFSAFANEDLVQQKKDSNAIKSLVESTQQLAAADLSCTKNSDCVALTIGKRACGGPNGFVIASKNNLVFEEVQYLAEQTEAREEVFNAKYGIYSICSIIMKPTPACVSKVCR